MALSENDLIEQDIEAYLDRHQHKELMRLLTCGSVDDGKSTLIGRLLHDTKLIYEDQLSAVQRDSKVHGTQGGEIDLALLVDGLQAEREQGITIDVAYRYFSTDRRKFIIADTPGHEQYTRNMATGASTCDLAVILIDARYGVQTQTKRHSFIVALLGIRHVVVAINKMDLVDYSEDVYNTIRSEYQSFAEKLDLPDTHFIPISALNGDNVVDPSTAMDWYEGQPLLDYLETVKLAKDRNYERLRFPIQYVNRPNLDFRGFSGTIASGIVRPGDEVVALPSEKRSRIARVYTFDGDLEEAYPPLAVTLTLEDEIDVSRGDMLVSPGDLPRVERDFEAMVVWMNDDPLRTDRQYLFQSTHNLVTGTMPGVRYTVNVNTLERTEAHELSLNEVGRCQVSLSRAIPFDAYRNSRRTGSFVIIDRQTNNTLGAGMIVDSNVIDAGEIGSFWEVDPPSELLRRKTSRVDRDEREDRYAQKAATVLLTGLTGVGKSTIAYALERRLFEAGRTVVVLDGENMRLGISRDLGFTARERSENMRRAAEVARIMNNAGILVICAFVAPDADTRERAREVIADARFVEVHLDAPIEVCRARDLHRMYARADSGEIDQFPGVSAPYDIPDTPDLALRTDEMDVEASVDRIVQRLEQRGIID